MRRGARGPRVGRECFGAALCVALVALPSALCAQGGPQLVYPGRVPSGGGLIIEGPLSEVVVTTLDDPMRELPGSLEERFGYKVWRADEPLPLGEYAVQLIAGGAYGPRDFVVEVVEPIEGAPRVVSEPSLTFVSKSIDSACCDLWFDGNLQRSGHCFGIVYTDSVVLDPGLSTPEPTYVIGQYLFQVRATEPYATTERAVPWKLVAPIKLDIEAERYCFTLDAIDIASGDVLPLRDEAVCVEHGELPALETRAVEPPDSVLDARQCHSPPPEYQPRWCEINADVCDTLRNVEETGCALHGFVCEAEPFPGTRSWFYFPNDARDAAVEEPSDEEEPVVNARREASGCSAAGGARSTTHESAGTIGLAVLILLGFARRRAARASKRTRALFAALALVLAGCGDGTDAPRVERGTSGRLGPGENGPVPLRSIPSNGALPLGLFAHMPEVTARDNYYEPLEGTVRSVMGYWVWLPSAPLQGDKLRVTLVYFSDSERLVRNELTYSVDVVEPYARRAPGLVSEPSASLHSTPLESACCLEWNGAELVPTFCSPTSYQDRVLLGPGLISADPDVALRQHVFAMYRALPDERQLVGVGLWQQWPEIIFEDQADEYCFEIEATDMNTGRLYGYRGLTPRCAEHGELPDLERHDADLTDDALDRAQCEVPPSGYEERWCKLNEAACKATPEAEECARSGYVCDGEPLPEPVDLGAAGFSALSLGSDEPQVIVTGSEPPDCGVARGRVYARPLLQSWFALLALVLARRTRRAWFARALHSRRSSRS